MNVYFFVASIELNGYKTCCSVEVFLTQKTMADDSWKVVLSRLQTEVIKIVTSDPTLTQTQLDLSLVPFNALACSIVDRLCAKSGIMQIDTKPWETRLPVLLWLSRSLGLPDHRSTDPDGLLHKLDGGGNHGMVRRVLAEWAVRVSNEGAREKSSRHHLGVLLTNEGYAQNRYRKTIIRNNPPVAPPPVIDVDSDANPDRQLPPKGEIIDEYGNHTDNKGSKKASRPDANEREELDAYGNRMGVVPSPPETLRVRKSARIV